MSKEPREFRMLREENSNRALLFSDCDVDAVAYPLFREVLPDQTGICPACATEFDLEEFTKCKSIIIEDLITLTAKVKRYEEALISIRDINCKDQVQYMNQEFALYSIHTIARAALNQGEGK